MAGMSLQEALADARRLFANFPEEVFTLWLDPCIQQHGWPPQGFAWQGFLFNQPKAFWQSVVWQQETTHLRADQLGHASQQLLRLVTEAAAGQPNLLSNQSPDTARRFAAAQRYITEHGSPPGTPLLLARPGGIEVVDGCHRLAALLQLQARQPAPAQPLPFKAWVGRPR